MKSAWFLNVGGQAKCNFVFFFFTVDLLAPLVFGAVIPLGVKKHELLSNESWLFFEIVQLLITFSLREVNC